MGIRDRLIAAACTKYDARSTIGSQRLKEMNESDTAGRVQTVDAGKICGTWNVCSCRQLNCNYPSQNECRSNGQEE